MLVSGHPKCDQNVDEVEACSHEELYPNKETNKKPSNKNNKKDQDENVMRDMARG